MKKQQTGIFAVLMFFIVPVQALVMDFETSTITNAATVSSSFTQNGLTLSPVDNGNVPTSFSHYDIFAGISTLATSSPTDKSAGIHTGNEGETVAFSFMGGRAFDLLSFDIEEFLIDPEFPDYELIGTFTSSSGAVANASSVGTIDFSILPGFQNITWFQFSAPLGVAGSCAVAGENCSTIVFDNIEFQEAVVVTPLPTAAWLFGTALLGFLGFLRKSS